MTNTSATGRRGKVATLIETRGLDGLGADLEARWTTEGDDRDSLRDLAEHVNRKLLARAIEDTDITAFDESIDGIYRHLTDEEVSTGVRVQTRRRLERAGVDVDRLKEEFVSRQAIHTYLTEYCDASYEADDRDRLATETEHIERLRQRTEAVTRSKLERLHREGELPIQDFSVLVDVQALCEECGAQRSVAALLAGEGCECVQTTN